jgi:two-component system, chemotaxis family, protein-glutamate methylesterase/glutaminase
MYEKITVLVADDSALMRKMISDMINSQLDMEVIDTAKNGEIAIQKIKDLNPDIVTLDVEMPVKNGIEALKEIKKISSTEVIMLSSLTTENSSTTIEALKLGAFDFIAKPSSTISLDIEKVSNDLFEKIRYAKAHRKKTMSFTPKEEIKVKQNYQTQTPTYSKRVEVVLIGASTGGPKVLFDIITKLPENLNVPVLVVQHMPAGFTKAFAERLDKNSQLRVVEASDGDVIKQNYVYIAPGGYHMTISSGKIKLDTTPSIHGVRPAVDKLFISASETYTGGMVACICTGMGKDGADGVRAVKANGGFIVAQDEASSTVYGMPKAAYETGCVDLVVPDYKIANELTRFVIRK